MIIVRKYDKNGHCDYTEHPSLFLALAYLRKHFYESEWCWVFYKKGVK